MMIAPARGARAGKVACALVLALSLGACALLPKDEGRFHRLVGSWIKIGMSVEDATATMRHQGFRVTRSPPIKGQTDRREFLTAQLSVVNFRIVCADEWRVILRIEDEKIASVRTMVFPNSVCL